MIESNFQYWFLIGLTGLSILCWMIVLPRFARGQALLRKSRVGEVPSNPEDLLLAFALFILVPAFCIELAKPLGWPPLLVSSFGWALLALGIRGYSAVRYSGQAFSTSRLSVLQGIRLGVITFAMWVPFTLLVQSELNKIIPYQHQTLEFLTDSTAQSFALNFSIVFFAAAIVTPFVEELIFRQLIQGWLQKLFSHQYLSGTFSLSTKSNASDSRETHTINWPAIIVSAGIFASLHFGQGAAPFALFVLALGIGYVYDRTGSLTACVVVHLLLNAMTIIFVGMTKFASL